MSILEIIGHIVVIIGLIFIAFGIIGIYRFNEFFQRLLISSKIDTVGTVTVIIGIMLIHGVGLFSARLLIIISLLVFLGPVSTHVVARSAFYAKDGKAEPHFKKEELPCHKP